MEMELGKHSFDARQNEGNKNNVNVGISQCVIREGYRHGLKRGPVKVRVRGPANKALEVYAIAERVCRELDAKRYRGPKTVTVKP